MSKEEILKIQTCVLKVNIHCDGCKQKVKKILQKIDGVYTTKIDSEQGKVTVSGNVDPSVLIKKLSKSGKLAEVWGAQKANNNQNQIKNMQMDNGKGGGGSNNNNNKGGQKGGNNNKGGQKGGNNNNNNQQQPKGGQFVAGQLTPQQLQQLQQMKGFPDLKLPALKLPPNQNNNNNQKTVKFNLPEEDDLTDGEYDDDDYDDDDDDYDDDEMDDPHHPILNKANPMMGKNGPLGPNTLMMNNPQLMKAVAAHGGGGNGGKKEGGGGAPVPVHVNIGGGNDGKNGNAGKKAAAGGGGGGGNNNNQQNQGGKNGGGMPQNGNNGGGANVNNGGGKKGSGGVGGGMNDGFRAMGGPQMSNMNMPMGQMGNIPAVQGLPMNGGGGGSGAPGGYFQGARPDLMPGNPYQQQQYMAMMNQQREMGNERFQPMMYARPPPAVNYMQPPYPYPYPPPHSDPYNFFSDENPSSCNVM